MRYGWNRNPGGKLYNFSYDANIDSWTPKSMKHMKTLHHDWMTTINDWMPTINLSCLMALIPNTPINWGDYNGHEQMPIAKTY